MGVSSRYIPDVREVKTFRAHRSPIHIAQQLGGGNFISAKSLNKISAAGTYSPGFINPAPTVIDIVFETQLYNNYCGPAAVKMVLSGIGITRSQTQIAGEIGTTGSGTPFGAALVNGMNGFVTGTAYAFILKWHSYTSTDTQTMRSNIIYAIDYGNPVLVNSDESDYEHIPGHQAAGIIYHYGCVNGYSYGGNSFLYTDPAHGFGSLTSVIKNQFLTTDTLSIALGGRGYVY